MSDEIRVNNNLLSWGSIVLKVASDRYTGFTGITYADKRERVKGYGLTKHHAPYGRSRGKYTIEPVKLVGWKKSVAALRSGLALLSSDGVSYGDVEVQIDLQYVEDDVPLQVEIGRCVWVSNSSSDEESADPLKEEIEFDAMWIKRNGLVLFDASEGYP